MKRIWVSLVAAALLTVAAIAPAAAQDTITIDMQEVDESGQSGSANITSDGEQVIVAIEIDAGPDGEPQPLNIHDGTCRDLGEVAYPLEDVVDGMSESSADISLSDIISGEYAIVVSQAEGEDDVIVACGTTPLIGGAAPAEDEEAAEDEDGADEAAEDDEAAEEDEDASTDEEDDAAAEDDDEDDDTEDLVPATGGAGMGAEGAVILMTVLSGAALGGGLLVRRRFAQV